MKDEILVRQLKAGKRDAFDLLYEKYKNLAIHTAYLITGNLPDSEDVVQETFVKAYLHIDELKKESGFKPWMLQILVRTAYRSGQKKSREIPDEELVLAVRDNNVSSPSLLQQIVREEEAEIISRAVRNLPIKQKAAVILYYYNGLSVEEIGKIEGCRAGTVKSRLYTARQALKESLMQLSYHSGEDNDEQRTG